MSIETLEGAAAVGLGQPASDGAAPLTGDAARAAIAAVVREVRDDYLARFEGGILAINDGRCADVAYDVLERLEGRLAVPAEDFETLNFCAVIDEEDVFDVELIERHWPATKPPAPLAWSDLDALGMSWTPHVWVTHEGRHYDVDVPGGVESFLDLPLFRRNLGARLLAGRPDLAEAVAGNPWWAETFRLQQELQDWADAREPEGTPAPGH